VDFNTRNIRIFDPSTFLYTGEIAMSAAFHKPENSENRYTTLYLRGNRLYAALYTGGSLFPSYKCDSAVVAVIDTDSDTYIKDIFMPDAQFAGQPFLRFQGPALDEDGNLYIVTNGGFGFNPTPAKILKIPAGQDAFDTSFTFMPQTLIAQSTASTIMNAGFVYEGAGIAYTNVLMENPASPTDLLGKPLMRWCRLDLNARTAELVEGIPANAGGTVGMGYVYEGVAILPVFNSDMEINALYEIGPDGAGQKVADISGGIIYGLYRME
jgi:hypothetical protein